MISPGRTSGPSVNNPIEGGDLLSRLLNVYERTRGSKPFDTRGRVEPGQIYSRYRPPGQVRTRFPWARPQRGA